MGQENIHDTIIQGVEERWLLTGHHYQNVVIGLQPMIAPSSGAKQDQLPYLRPDPFNSLQEVPEDLISQLSRMHERRRFIWRRSGEPPSPVLGSECKYHIDFLEGKEIRRDNTRKATTGRRLVQSPTSVYSY